MSEITILVTSGVSSFSKMFMPLPRYLIYAGMPSQHQGAALRSGQRRRLPFQWQDIGQMELVFWYATTG